MNVTLEGTVFKLRMQTIKMRLEGEVCRWPVRSTLVVKQIYNITAECTDAVLNLVFLIPFHPGSGRFVLSFWYTKEVLSFV